MFLLYTASNLYAQKSLSFVPLPLLVLQQDKYDECQNPNDKICPSLQRSHEVESDLALKAVLVSTKVQAVIVCGECHRPCCIYSRKKLNDDEKAQM